MSGGALRVILAILGVLSILALSVILPIVIEAASNVSRRNAAERAYSVSAYRRPTGQKPRPVPSVVTLENMELGITGSGVIIGEQWVLTSAHNVMRLDGLLRRTDVVSRVDALRVSIRSKWAVVGQERRVTRVWIHQAYSSGVGMEKMIDIALLKLDSPWTPVADVGNAAYWSVANLPAPRQGLPQHGLKVDSAVWGAISDRNNEKRTDYFEDMTLSEQLVVPCGDPLERLQNPNTFCTSTASAASKQGCSGDTGAPIMHGNVAIGVVMSSARHPYCSEGLQKWAISVSTARLRQWLDSIFRESPFACTEVTATRLIEHDVSKDFAETVGQSDTFCGSDGSVYRLNGRDLTYQHCSSGRAGLKIASSLLRPCSKRCRLTHVPTLQQDSVEDEDYLALPVRCTMSAGVSTPYRLTGRTRGVVLFGTAQSEVLPCQGGLPLWKKTSELVACERELCMMQPPVDFLSALQPICDKDGNPALATGHRRGWIDESSRWIPIALEEKVQVFPCGGGVPQWIYAFAARACLQTEIEKCRGPENIPRRFSPSSSRHHEVFHEKAGPIDVQSLMGDPNDGLM